VIQCTEPCSPLFGATRLISVSPRWVCTSAEGADLETTDELAASVLEGIVENKGAECEYTTDQLQLVPSGGDSGPRRDQPASKIFCPNIRVQLREIKCMELVS
jgi:hypothetical protein